METDTPITAEQALDEVKGLLGANTTGDALRVLRELVQRQPLVWHDGQGKLGIASMTVRQVVQLVAALESLTVK